MANNKTVAFRCDAVLYEKLVARVAELNGIAGRVGRAITKADVMVAALRKYLRTGTAHQAAEAEE